MRKPIPALVALAVLGPLLLLAAPADAASRYSVSVAVGADRADVGQGVVLSTYGQDPSEPAGDLVPAMALAKQLEKMGQVMSNAAGQHETVKLAGDIGSHLASKSFIDQDAAPFKAMRIAVSGMVDEVNPDRAEADAVAKNISASDDKLPHTTDPIVAVAAKAGSRGTGSPSLSSCRERRRP